MACLKTGRINYFLISKWIFKMLHRTIRNIQKWITRVVLLRGIFEGLIRSFAYLVIYSLNISYVPPQINI